MPHCIIEHSNSLFLAKTIDNHENSSVQGLSQSMLSTMVFDACAASGLFNCKDIKTRVMAYDTFQIGSGQNVCDFIHVTLKILSGRTDEQKQQLATQVLNQLTSLKLSATSISVEICDIDRNSYVKLVS